MTLSIVLVRLGFISLAQATAALTCTVCSDLCVAVPPDLAIDRFNAIVSSDLLFFSLTTVVLFCLAVQMAKQP